MPPAWTPRAKRRSKRKKRIAARIPLGRYGNPEEVAQVMLFLAGGQSGFCTGGIYMVDGGRTIGYG